MIKRESLKAHVSSLMAPCSYLKACVFVFVAYPTPFKFLSMPKVKAGGSVRPFRFAIYSHLKTITKNGAFRGYKG